MQGVLPEEYWGQVVVSGMSDTGHQAVICEKDDLSGQYYYVITKGNCYKKLESGFSSSIEGAKKKIRRAILPEPGQEDWVSEEPWYYFDFRWQWKVENNEIGLE